MLARSRPRAWFALSLLANLAAALAIMHLSRGLVAAGATAHGLRWAHQAEAETVTVTKLCDELGPDFVRQAVGHQGANARLRRVLAKMRRGEPFTVAVVGGSVSRGQGLRAFQPSEQLSPYNMHRIVFDHLDALFPHALPAGATPPPDPLGLYDGKQGIHIGLNGIVNGAQAAMGSEYFSMCHAEHVPDDVDLVLLEVAINDILDLSSFDSYELLVRALLDLPNSPALINMNVIALMFNTIATGSDMHHGLAAYYDIPTLSLRDPLLPRILQNHTLIEDWFCEDGLHPGQRDLRHVNRRAHKAIGELVTAYIDTQLCEMDALEAAASTTDADALYPLQPVPRLLLSEPYDPSKVAPPIRPKCYSMNAIRSPLVPLTNDGWRLFNYEQKKYWIADVPGSRISFKFSTTAGVVKLYYQRSATFGFGAVRCWVDDDVRGAVSMDGYWDYAANIGQSNDVRTDLRPGEHTLHCELLDGAADPGAGDGKEFRIISVMSY
ncbi:hypothetical protein Q5752_005998 [Cryptotrichosporon argae]